MPDSNAKPSFMDSFRLQSRYSCELAIRNGGVAALISATITALFAAAGFFINSADAALSDLMDPWLTVDVALILMLAIFVFRKSRVASTTLVAYFVASKLALWYQLGSPQGLPLSLLFLAYYVTAMRATYIWHSSYRDRETETAAVNVA